MRYLLTLILLASTLATQATRIEQELIEINASGYNAAVRITPTNSAYAPADLSAPIMTGPTRIYTPVAGVLTISNLVEGSYTFEQAGKRLTFTVTNSLPTITNSIRELVSAGLVYGVNGPGFPGVVKVTPTDTTPAVLSAKLVAGSNITITTNNASGNATLTITGAAAGGSDTNGLATTNYVNEIISSIASDAITNNDTRVVSFAGGSIALSGGDGFNQWSITNVSAVEDEGLHFIGEAGESVARFIWNENAPGIWAHNFYGLNTGLTNASGQTISTNITDSGTNIIVAGNVEAPNLIWLWQDIPNTSQMLAGAGQGIPSYHTNSVGVGYYSLQGSPGNYNSSLGVSSLRSSPGANNSSLGVSSLQSSPGNNNSSLGASSLQNSPGNDNSSLGYYSLRYSPGINNSSLGAYALQNSSGNNNSSLGANSLQFSPGNNNSSLGYYSLRYSPGNNNSSLGYCSLYQTTGSFNFAGGYYAGEKLNTGSSNVYIGPFSGPANYTSESNKLYIANAPGTPLIGGDFAEKRIDLDGNLTVDGVISGNGAGLTGVTAASVAAANVTENPVIHDNDWGWDIDNELALVMNYRLHEQGYLKLLATPVTLGLQTTVNSEGDSSALYIDKFNTFYNFHIPTGYSGIDSDENGAPYNVETTGFASHYASTSDVPSAITVYRQLLSGIKPGGKKVKFVFNGNLMNLDALYDSAADTISPLTGAQLITNAVAEIIIQDGRFDGGDLGATIDNGKWGFSCGFSNSWIATTNFGVQVTFIGTEAADVFAPYVIAEQPAGMFANAIARHQDITDYRDVMPILYAAFGTNTGLFDYTYGTFSPATNATYAGYWVTNAGTMRHVNLTAAEAVYTALLDDAVKSLHPLNAEPPQVTPHYPKALTVNSITELAPAAWTLDSSVGIRPSPNTLKTNGTRNALCLMTLAVDPNAFIGSAPFAFNFHTFDQAETSTNTYSFSIQPTATDPWVRQHVLPVRPNEVYYWSSTPSGEEDISISIITATMVYQ